VPAYPISEFLPLSQAPSASILSASTPIPESLPPPVTVNVYIWAAPLSQLQPSLWSYDTFVKEKLHLWVGTRAEETNPDYLEVDKRRKMQGKIVGVIPEGGEGKINIEETNEYTFGHPMKKYFAFADSYVNLNNGTVTFL
jgi:hercynylcysteine S-oxide lyase